MKEANGRKAYTAPILESLDVRETRDIGIGIGIGIGAGAGVGS